MIQRGVKKGRKKHKTLNKMNFKSNKNSGFTLTEIVLVVAGIGLLAAIAIPNFVKARTTRWKNACVANLKQINGAKEQFALQNQLDVGVDISEEGVNGFLKNATTPPCPGSGSYKYNVVGTVPTCSLFDEGHFF